MELTCNEVKHRQEIGDDLVLLDCREEDELAVVQLPDALWIPMGQLTERLDELQAYRDRDLVIFCHHGGRSLQVTQWLRDQGWPRVYSMTGGIDQWAAEVDTTLTRY